MRTETPPLIRLEDYRPTDYLIETVNLDIRLAPEATRVVSRLSIRPREGTRRRIRRSCSTATALSSRASRSIRRRFPQTPSRRRPTG